MAASKSFLASVMYHKSTLSSAKKHFSLPLTHALFIFYLSPTHQERRKDCGNDCRGRRQSIFCPRSCTRRVHFPRPKCTFSSFHISFQLAFQRAKSGKNKVGRQLGPGLQGATSNNEIVDEMSLRPWARLFAFCPNLIFAVQNLFILKETKSFFFN